MDAAGWEAIAAWIAAVIAMISTGFTLWLQWRRRAEPEWAAVPVGVTQSVQNQMLLMRRKPTSFGAELTNVGDGAAFDVQARLDGNLCEVLEIGSTGSAIRLTPLVGAVMPGVRFGIVLPHDLRTDEDHELVVTWTASPTRLGRRWEQRLPLTKQGFGPRRPAARTARS